MTLDEFEASFGRDAPPSGISAPLAALWWAARGDWEKAHGLVQDEPGQQAAWVHAHLHRVEGDDSNAGYWYRRAGRARVDDALETEHKTIATALLSAA